LGFVLDVGCGIGRNLANLGPGNAVGVDPNKDAITTARERGLTAFTPDELTASEYARDGRFDSLLVSHVLEHLSPNAARDLVSSHLRYVKAGGRVVLITPQEAGYRSDATHIEFVDLNRLAALSRGLGLLPEAAYSFPFPRPAGNWFKYNEFIHIARKA
jgi:2-polyprenyl-3-methyl-5-hydroxy-6-metoxy-1,4-benzoquinol methylase